MTYTNDPALYTIQPMPQWSVSCHTAASRRTTAYHCTTPHPIIRPTYLRTHRTTTSCHTTLTKLVLE